VPVLAKEMSRF